MKIIFGLIFISTQALTQVTCDPAIKSEQIYALEEINNTILSTSADCAEEENNTSICSLEEQKQKYSTILAKLVLAKGLDALGKDVEVSYDDIQNISAKKIIEAKKSIDDFEIGLIKAQVLATSFKVKNRKKILNSTDIDHEELMNEDCTNNPSQTCEDLGTLSEINRKKVFEFMNGFSRASREAYDQRDQESKYTEILGTLSFEHNGQTKSILDFKKSDDYKKVQEIKKKLLSLAKDRSEENAIEIITLSKNLKNLKANFGNNVSTSDDIIQEVRDELESDLSSLSNAYTVLTKSAPVKESLKQTLKHIETESLQSLANLETDIKENFSNECVDKETADCIIHLKQTKPNVASELINRFDKIIKTDQYGTILKSAQKCLEPNEIKKEQAKCIEKLKDTYPNMYTSNIAELEKELEKSHKIIKNFSNIPEIEDLERQKLVALTILKSNNCIDQDSIELTCNNANIADQATLSLSSNLNSVITQISIQDYKALSKVVINTDTIEEGEVDEDNLEDEVEREGPQRSRKSRSVSSSKTRKLTDKEIQEKRQKARIANRKIRVKERTKKREARYEKSIKKGSSTANFFSGFTNTLAMGVPQMMYQANQRTQIVAQREANQQYYDYYTTALQNQATYYNNNGLYMNWGSNAYNPYYSNNFNYNNSNLYYNNSSNYYQYTYGASNQNFSYYDTSSSSSTTTSNTPFTFSF